MCKVRMMMKLAEILPDLPPESHYSCSELARRIGRHPNTLRKYELWGFISPVPRRANGYRFYTRTHALEALFSVTALRTCFRDWRERRRIKEMIRTLLARDYASLLEQLLRHRASLQADLEMALAARAILERRHRRPAGLTAPGIQAPPLSRREAAAGIGVAPDTLRDWERNRLVSPRRSPNGRRLYGPGDMDTLIIIRTLRQAGYSLMGILHLFEGKTRLEDLTFAADRWDESLRGFIADTYLLEEIIRELGEGGRAPIFPSRIKIANGR